MSTVWLLVRAVLLVVAGVLAGSWLDGVARGALDRTRLDPVVREAAVRLVRPLVIALAVLMALASVGLDATGAVAVTAAAVLAVGIGFKDALANAAAGALLLTTRPYRSGDRVKLAGTKGVVTEMTLFATTLETAEGVLVTLSSQRVLAEAVENHSRRGFVRAEVAVRVAATADLAKVATAVTDAIGADERFAKEPAPTVLAEGLGGDGLDLRVSAWVKADDADASRSALVLIARDVLKKAKVELAAASR